MEKRKVIAVTVIHRCTKPGVRGDKAKGIASVKPETQVIKPGTLFTVDQDEFKELFAAGAIRVPDPDEKVYVPVSVAEVADEDEKPAKPAKAAAGGKPAKPAKPAADEENLV